MNIVLCSREEEQRTLAHGLVLCTEDEADFLMHYGVKGMKRGIRQWQNEDGSLTPEGYIHYGIGQGNKGNKKVEKADKKVQKAQQKLDKHIIKSNSLAGRIFGNKAKQNTKELQLKRQLEVAQANKRLAEEKVKKQEEKGLAKFEKDKQKEEFIKRNTLTEEDKVSIEEHDKAGTEFNGNKEHDDALRNVSKEAIKERIQTTRDWFNDEQYESPEERVMSLKHFKDNEKNYRDLARKNVGDDMLSYLHEQSSEYSKLFNPGGKWDSKAYNEAKNDPKFKDYQDLSHWLTNKIYDVSGSWNAGEFKPNSNAGKAYSEYGKTTDDLWNREQEVKREQNIPGDVGRYSHSRKNEKEYAKLQKALKNDSVYQSLTKAYDKAEGDLCGAILKDLGFRDTPENRYLITEFAFID